MRANRMAGPGDTLAIAFSGGNDSLAMTLLLKELAPELGFSLVLFHVNHHIRGAAADADAMWAMDFGKQLDIPVHVFDVEPVQYSKEHSGISVEEAARILRYQAMAEGIAELERQKAGLASGEGETAASDRVVLAVAHHLEDEAETILFRLARGTGPAGIEPMKPVSRMCIGTTGSQYSQAGGQQEITIIRPVLPLTRAELEAVVSASPYTAREDVTNEDDDIARNRIRHRILPELSVVNSGAAGHIAAFAEKTGDLYEFLEEETKKVPGLLLREEGGGASLVRATLNPLPRVQKECAVRLWLSENAVPMRDIGEAQIEAIIDSAASDKGPGKRTDLAGGYSAVTGYDYVRLERTKKAADDETRNACHDSRTQDKVSNAGPGSGGLLMPEPVEPIRIPLAALADGEPQTFECPGGLLTFRLLTGEAAHSIVSQEIPQKNYTKYFDYDRINSDSLCLRTRNEGDRIAFSAGKSKGLRRYFIDEKVPVKERENILLLADGPDILWVIGYRIGAAYKVSGNTERVLEARYVEALH